MDPKLSGKGVQLTDKTAESSGDNSRITDEAANLSEMEAKLLENDPNLSDNAVNLSEKRAKLTEIEQNSSDNLIKEKMDSDMSEKDISKLPENDDKLSEHNSDIISKNLENESSAKPKSINTDNKLSENSKSQLSENTEDKILNNSKYKENELSENTAETKKCEIINKSKEINAGQISPSSDNKTVISENIPIKLSEKTENLISENTEDKGNTLKDNSDNKLSENENVECKSFENTEKMLSENIKEKISENTESKMSENIECLSLETTSSNKSEINLKKRNFSHINDQITENADESKIPENLTKKQKFEEKSIPTNFENSTNPNSIDSANQLSFGDSKSSANSANPTNSETSINFTSSTTINSVNNTISTNPEISTNMTNSANSLDPATPLRSKISANDITSPDGSSLEELPELSDEKLTEILQQNVMDVNLSESFTQEVVNSLAYQQNIDTILPKEFDSLATVPVASNLAETLPVSFNSVSNYTENCDMVAMPPGSNDMATVQNSYNGMATVQNNCNDMATIPVSCHDLVANSWQNTNTMPVIYTTSADNSMATGLPVCYTSVNNIATNCPTYGTSSTSSNVLTEPMTNSDTYSNLPPFSTFQKKSGNFLPTFPSESGIHMNSILDNCEDDLDDELPDLAAFIKSNNVGTKDFDMATEDPNVAADAQNVVKDYHNVTTDDQNMVADNQNVAADDESVATSHQNVAAGNHDMATNNQNLSTDDHDMETEDLVNKDQDLATKDQDLATKDQDLATKDQDLATKDQVLAIKDQDLATKDQVMATKGQDLPTEDQDLPTEDQDLPTEDQDLPTEDQDLATEDQDLPTEDQDLANEDLNVASDDQDTGSDADESEEEKTTKRTWKFETKSGIKLLVVDERWSHLDQIWVAPDTVIPVCKDCRFKTARKLREHLMDDPAIAIRLLQSHLLIKGIKICTRCNIPMKYDSLECKVYCNNQGKRKRPCQYKEKIIKDSVFESVRKPIVDAVLFLRDYADGQIHYSKLQNKTNKQLFCHIKLQCANAIAKYCAEKGMKVVKGFKSEEYNRMKFLRNIPSAKSFHILLTILQKSSADIPLSYVEYEKSIRTENLGPTKYNLNMFSSRVHSHKLLDHCFDTPDLWPIKPKTCKECSIPISPNTKMDDYHKILQSHMLILMDMLCPRCFNIIPPNFASKEFICEGNAYTTTCNYRCSIFKNTALEEINGNEHLIIKYVEIYCHEKIDNQNDELTFKPEIADKLEAIVQKAITKYFNVRGKKGPKSRASALKALGLEFSTKINKHRLLYIISESVCPYLIEYEKRAKHWNSKIGVIPEAELKILFMQGSYIEALQMENREKDNDKQNRTENDNQKIHNGISNNYDKSYLSEIGWTKAHDSIQTDTMLSKENNSRETIPQNLQKKRNSSPLQILNSDLNLGCIKDDPNVRRVCKMLSNRNGLEKIRQSGVSINFNLVEDYRPYTFDDKEPTVISEHCRYWVGKENRIVLEFSESESESESVD